MAYNLLEALRFFGRAREDAEILDLPGESLIFCGLNYAAFNAALLAQPVEGDASELDRLIRLPLPGSTPAASGGPIGSARIFSTRRCAARPRASSPARPAALDGSARNVHREARATAPQAALARNPAGG